MSVHSHDALFKIVFSEAENAVGLFRHLLPSPLGNELDWETLRVESSEYLSEKDFGKSASDIVCSVRTRDDPPYKVYLTAEHQSEPRQARLFPFRILRYQTDLWARELREATRTRQPKFLPAIFSAVVCHGQTSMASADGAR